MKCIPVAGPSITEREIEYVADAARNAWYEGANDYYSRFENAMGEYLSVQYTVSLPHCTSGIHLALVALEVAKDDEVIVPDITWIATAAPISYVGAKPVFVDVDPDTWCICPDAIERAISDKTKAIIAVDLYGGMPNWDRVLEIAERHGIPVIEDAAEAIGSEYKGRKAGAIGRLGVFSFHGSKTMTTGEGGLLATDDCALFDRVMFLRDHGRVPGDTMFQNAEVAFKYKMSAMQAAMGLAQLERIDELVDKKREIFAWYAARLSGHQYLRLNVEPSETKNSYWMSSVIVDPAIRMPKESLIRKLAENGIGSRPFFSPLTSIPAYNESPSGRNGKERNPVAYRVSPQSINLPSALCLREADVDRVCNVLLDILSAAG